MRLPYLCGLGASPLPAAHGPVFTIYDSPGSSPWLLHLLCLPVLSRVCSPTHPLIHLVHVSRTPAMCQTTVLGAENVVLAGLRPCLHEVTFQWGRGWTVDAPSSQGW